MAVVVCTVLESRAAEICSSSQELDSEEGAESGGADEAEQREVEEKEYLWLFYHPKIA